MISAILFTACNKNEDISNSKAFVNEQEKSVKNKGNILKTTSTESDVIWAGTAHNDVIDLVYQELTLYYTEKYNQSDSIEFIYENMLDKTFQIATSVIQDNYGLDTFNLMESYLTDYYYQLADSNYNLGSNLWFPENNDDLSQDQKYYLSSLNSALENQSLSVSEIVSVFNDVKADAKDNLSSDEFYVILSAVEVGKNTIQYWDDNIEEWYDLYTDQGGSTSISWRGAGEADVKGAIGGAISAAISGGGIGIGAAAGAIGGSTAYVVVELWKKWCPFGWC
ncbi:MAG: hypothetical protein CMC96_01870 [Flavobacteriales bacterium]|nr:hypothetical protein [Flavobacteriales bacterium]|tara:strand:+ start:93 stop:932 length:840 start_codon:yes stop_codon:yes gene_type:complete